MNTLKTQIDNYLLFCQFQKCLDEKTLKAYRIDLAQFQNNTSKIKISNITINDIETFIVFLHRTYKPKTAKRKIASIKAFYHYLEYKDLITLNPFNKLQIKFRDSIVLPKTIPLYIVEKFLRCIYAYHSASKTEYQFRTSLRDIAVIELLFATGIRISELCMLKKYNVDLIDKSILVYGKGRKERRIQLGNDDVVNVLAHYCSIFHNNTNHSDFFFINVDNSPLSDQAIRRMIKKYCTLANIEMHITPHMFRHTFATSLLESDVDIRYIQEILGHSSINITEIYTHVTISKQKEILRNRHPRNKFTL